MDLGIGFCGLSAYLPCQNRLACLPCPHFLPTRENLPLYGRQRANLIELRMLGGRAPPAGPPSRDRRCRGGARPAHRRREPAAIDTLLGPGVEVGCAQPRTVLPAPVTPTGCVQCLADALLDPAYERDGISLLGGDPFFQPDGLWALVQALRTRRCPPILVYSGYTYERLRRMARTQAAIGAVLEDVDILIYGPFIAMLADRSGPWTGSGNQRVINLLETRQTQRLVLWPMRGGSALNSPLIAVLHPNAYSRTSGGP